MMKFCVTNINNHMDVNQNRQRHQQIFYSVNSSKPSKISLDDHICLQYLESNNSWPFFSDNMLQYYSCIEDCQLVMICSFLEEMLSEIERRKIEFSTQDLRYTIVFVTFILFGAEIDDIFLFGLNRSGSMILV